jgi:hypothetical protein
VVGSNVNVSWVCYHGSSNDFDGIVLCRIGSGMIGSDWLKGEDARMEYEVIEDDSGIDWDDPAIIAEVFAQTDTKFDKFLDKAADILFHDVVSYVGIIIGASLFIVLSWHVVRWIL